MPVTAADRDVINRMSEITNALSQKGSVAFTFMQVSKTLEQAKAVFLGVLWISDKINSLTSMYVMHNWADQCLQCKSISTIFLFALCK